MRKILLSAFVIFSFLSYAVYIRMKGSVETPKVSFAPTQIPVSKSPTITIKQPITVTQQQTVTTQPIALTTAPQKNSFYKDGVYTGDAADAVYGNIQVKITITNGKISNVQFLEYPNDQGTSTAINQQADPILAQEAIQSQSAQVDIVSSATDTSQAFIKSMQSALIQAKS